MDLQDAVRSERERDANKEGETVLLVLLGGYLFRGGGFAPWNGNFGLLKEITEIYNSNFFTL